MSNDGRILFKKTVPGFNGLGSSRQPQNVMVPTDQNGVLFHRFGLKGQFSSDWEGEHYACAVDSAGRVLWEVLYSNRRCERLSFLDVVLSDGSGGAIFAWGENVPARGIWMQQVSRTGKLGEVTHVLEPSTRESTPQDFRLFPVYPNPFHQDVHISYRLVRTLRISLRIYDVSGREVIALVEQQQPQGLHEIVWDGLDRYGTPVSNGVYFCVLSTAVGTQIRKFALSH
ncbi:MAG: T9SS type A sorting domain-containing protein [candidate division KSB1 bacterium]|jgi:hypothetical protein|nr:T9SS type A sorting domain-containing protein [candidate division KSB1 bacterium]MDH7475674.1 T9SS type A sorting domain-containing protein [Anaerolineae bacterium]